MLHYVTGDPLAYRHTAAVIGGTDGKIVALDVTTLAWTSDSEDPSRWKDVSGSVMRASSRPISPVV